MKKSALGLLSCLLASACTVAPPFKRSDALKRTATPDATAIIALTHARLGKDKRKNDVFWDYTNKVLDSVPGQAGYLGHGVRLKLFGGEAWTMTVWEDQASLNSFVNSAEHRAAIRMGYAAIAEARFAQVTVKRSAVPIPWDQAVALLRDQGRGSE